MLFSALTAACSTSISVQADDKNGASVTFDSQFSEAATQTLRSLISTVAGSSSDESIPIIAASDVRTVMEAAGFSAIAAKNTSTLGVSASGTYPVLSTGPLPATGLLTRTKKSLTLTLGPTQYKMLYGLSTEETQMYFDLLMIPALTDEQLTVEEYTGLLAGLYGTDFAKSLASGTISIELRSPDGKKKTTATLSLGEALTLTTEKQWTVQW